MRAERVSSYTRQMRMLKIEDSSSVIEIGHDGVHTMAVRFVAGSLYEYSNVGADLFGKILSAESVGKVLDKEVKKFPIDHPCKKVESPATLQEGAVVVIRPREVTVKVLEVSSLAHGLCYLLQLPRSNYFADVDRQVWLDATEFEVM